MIPLKCNFDERIQDKQNEIHRVFDMQECEINSIYASFWKCAERLVSTRASFELWVHWNNL